MHDPFLLAEESDVHFDIKNKQTHTFWRKTNDSWLQSGIPPVILFPCKSLTCKKLCYVACFKAKWVQKHHSKLVCVHVHTHFNSQNQQIMKIGQWAMKHITALCKRLTCYISCISFPFQWGEGQSNQDCLLAICTPWKIRQIRQA